jgi:hypothetical protein
MFPVSAGAPGSDGTKPSGDVPDELLPPPHAANAKAVAQPATIVRQRCDPLIA